LPRVQSSLWTPSHSPGFYATYFLVRKKGGGLRPILDLRILNKFLRIFTFPCAEHSGRSSYRGQGGMVHVRRLEGRLLSCAYCASSQAVSSLCLQRSSFPVQGAPIWTLPLLDDWLICAPSRLQTIQDTALLLSHVARLGLKVNMERSCRNPSQSLTFIGVALDTVTQPAKTVFSPPLLVDVMLYSSSSRLDKPSC